MVKVPKISINDEEANALLSTLLDTAQHDANKRFLDAFISAMEKASTNHVSAISTALASFHTALNEAIVSIASQNFINLSIPSSEWEAAAKAAFDDMCDVWLLNHIVKKSAKEQAATVRQERHDTARNEADRLPAERSVSQLINDKFLRLQQEMLSLLGKHGAPPPSNSVNNKKKTASDSSVKPPPPKNGSESGAPPRTVTTPASGQLQSNAKSNQNQNGETPAQSAGDPGGSKKTKTAFEDSTGDITTRSFRATASTATKKKETQQKQKPQPN